MKNNYTNYCFFIMLFSIMIYYIYNLLVFVANELKPTFLEGCTIQLASSTAWSTCHTNRINKAQTTNDNRAQLLFEKKKTALKRKNLKVK